MTTLKIEARLRRIEARAEQAWRGPWKARLDKDPFGGSDQVLQEIRDELRDEARIDGMGYRDLLPWCVPETLCLSSMYGEMLDKDTAQFIAHARSDIPWLIRRLRELLEPST